LRYASWSSALVAEEREDWAPKSSITRQSSFR
jgi:hypothetical protein